MSQSLQVMRLAEQAMELSPDDIEPFLERECRGNDDLRSEVERLLQACEHGTDLLPEGRGQGGAALRPPADHQPFGSDPNRSASLLAPGDLLLNRYEIVESIGSGGMGEVFLARDRVLGRHVAVKTLNKACLGAKGMRARFTREMRALAALSDPNIVSIHDIAEHDGMEFAVMEYVAGKTLRQLTAEPLEADTITQLIVGIASGLAAAHRVNIVHRDIKPENLMVQESGRARILDFGLARQELEALADDETKASMIAGTVPYMSPEQIQNRELSCATDVFSLGVVAFELISGKNPYRASSLFQTMQNLSNANPPDRSDVDDSVPSQVVELILSMLDRDPTSRPTAAEVVDQLSTGTSSTTRISPAATEIETLDPRSEEEILQQLLLGVSDSVGRQFFRALTKSLAEAMGTYSAMVTEFDKEGRRAKALAFWTADGWFEGYEYTIAETPCESVFDKLELFHYPNHLRDLFPTDHDIPEMGMISYMGVPLLDSDGSVLGNLAVLDRKPMPPKPRCVSLLKMFANRAAAEHRRLKREDELRDRERRLTQILDGVSDAMIEFDHALTVTRINRSAEELFATTPPQVLGHSVANLLGLSDDASIRQFARQLATTDDSSVLVPLPNDLLSATAFPERILEGATLTRTESATGPYFNLIIRQRTRPTPNERSIDEVRSATKLLREEIAESKLANLIGSSERFREVKRLVELVAATDTTVFIRGETGTGKELVARAIHAAGHHCEQPFACLHCSIATPNQLESLWVELLNEHNSSKGTAGTLFLHDIAEASEELQRTLLQLLVNKQTPPHQNVRLIVASSYDLEAKVDQGTLRKDLFFRLNVFPLVLPPLRERGDDVLILAEHFAQEIDRSMRRSFIGLTDDCRQRLTSYDWPGNIRELRNIVERALITSSGGLLDLDGAFRNGVSPASLREVITDPTAREVREEMLEIERRNLCQALKICGGKIEGEQGAASLLQLSPRELANRMQQLGL